MGWDWSKENVRQKLEKNNIEKMLFHYVQKHTLKMLSER